MMENNKSGSKDSTETDVDAGAVKRCHSSAKNMPQSTNSSDAGIEGINSTATGSGSTCENVSFNDSSPSASPPRKVLISALKEKLLDEERAQRVKIAHEIAFNKDFRLPDESEPPAPDDKSAEAKLTRLEKNVKEIMHRAFWDSLRSDIESEPPKYNHAFVLLQEIKEILLSLLPENRVTSFHKRIDEYMDLDLFRQQAENDTLNVKNIATFIVDIMAGMCAPIRDDQVAQLRSIEDVVDLFKGIEKTLSLMKIDLMNFEIKSIRPHIERTGFEYERTEFAKLLKNSTDGLKITRQWISATYQEVQNELEKLNEQGKNERLGGATSGNVKTDKKYDDIAKAALSPFSVLKTAFTKLLSHEMNLDQLPETLQMDRKRIDGLRQQIDQIVLVSAVMITSCGVFGQPLASHNEFLSKMKENLMVLTAPTQNRDLSDLLERLSLHCWNEAVNYSNGKGPEIERCVNDLKENVLKSQITALNGKDTHPVYNVIYKRAVGYLGLTTDILAHHSSTTPPNLPPLPAGLAFASSELVKLALQFAKLVNLNRTIYGPFYVPILKEVLGIPNSGNNTPSSEEKKLPKTNHEESGARRKLDMGSSNTDEKGKSDDTPINHKGKYEVTGSLEDLD